MNKLTLNEPAENTKCSNTDLRGRQYKRLFSPLHEICLKFTKFHAIVFNCSLDIRAITHVKKSVSAKFNFSLS